MHYIEIAHACFGIATLLSLEREGYKVIAQPLLPAHADDIYRRFKDIH